MNIKKLKPLQDRILTTMNLYEYDIKEGGIITKSKGAVKEYQQVLAVGDFVKNIKPGDMVMISPDRYAVRKFKEDSLKNDLMTNDVVRYNLPVHIVDGQPRLLISDRDVQFVIEEWDVEDEKESLIEIPSKTIIC